jgi:hypothetical protein
VAELPDRGKEAEPKVVGGDLFEELLQSGLVVRTQRPGEEFRAVAEFQPLFPPGRIGAHREPVIADALEFRLGLERRDGDTDVERESPALVGKERVDDAGMDRPARPRHHQCARGVRSYARRGQVRQVAASV